jgi:hypothetical protein
LQSTVTYGRVEFAKRRLGYARVSNYGQTLDGPPDRRAERATLTELVQSYDVGLATISRLAKKTAEWVKVNLHQHEGRAGGLL